MVRSISLQERQRHKKLGQILMEQGLILRENLAKHIRFQIEEAVYYLFTWSEGTFTFEADVEAGVADSFLPRVKILILFC